MTIPVGKHWSSTEVNQLGVCLSKLPAVPSGIGPTFSTSAERLLDCVLSLHRRYDEFAVPRIKNFKAKHPNVNTLADLSKSVLQSGGPVVFYQQELDYGYPDAAQMFGRVLNYLENQLKYHPGADDITKLNRWACTAPIIGYNTIWTESGVKTNIPMFGIAGWQYLRMLFGADTCKPDIAVNGFVKECLGRSYISPVSIVGIMEAAAPTAPGLNVGGQPVREADRRIWHRYNGLAKTKRTYHRGSH